MAPKLVDLKFRLQGLIREDKETGAFVSYCPALDLYSAGKTRPDAKSALRGAVQMYIKICLSRDILYRVLKDNGFEATEAAVAGAEMDGAGVNFISVTVAGQTNEYDDMFQVEVPLHLIAQQQQGAVA